MKAILLSAGRGTRLGAQELPKALTVLADGRTLLAHQLSGLERCCPRADISVVVGYRQEMIRTAFPDLHYVENRHFAEENTAKSLLKALNVLPAEDILWINGDVVFRSAILHPLVQSGRTALLVNRAKVGAEEVKYRTDGSGRILQISKQLLQPEGESVGIHYFAKRDISTLIAGLKACRPMDYFEAGIEYAIQRGVTVMALSIEETDSVEIDFPEDVALANQRLKIWSRSSR